MTQDDVELAGNLQERLVAGSERFDRPGFRGEAWSRPAKGVGGDLWFARPLAGERSFLALCDISGKGVAASLVVAMVWGMLRAFDLGRGLPALLAELNDAVLSSFHTEKYLTGVFLVVEPRAGRVLLADMGHAHVALLRGGRAQAVRTPRANLPLGIERDIEPAVFSLPLLPGDGLLVYSDGIPEQENPDGEEFGEAGLLGRSAAILAAGGDLGRELPTLFDAHRAGSPQQDDMTFLWLETRRGEGGWGSRR
jgi:sigma-B regulation protein RsbU (phosphoserine phosphatase)